MARSMTRTLVALQLLLVTLLFTAPLTNAISLAKRGVSECTNTCWFGGITQASCVSDTGDSKAETACMCSSLTNWDYFSDCNVLCEHQGQFTGLSKDQQCIDHHHRVVRNEGPVPSASIPLGVLPSGISSSPSPEPYSTSDTRDTPTSMIANFLTSVGDLPPITLSTSYYKRQMIGQVPWRHDTTAVSKTTPVYTHSSVPATVGFCGVPGSSCNELIGSSAAGSASVADSTSIAALQVRDTATFVPSLVRMCLLPDLVDCYIPLAPNFADVKKDRGMEGMDNIIWAPTTLAIYAPNTNAGLPTHSGESTDGMLATYGLPPAEARQTVTPSGDCEIGGICGAEKRDTVPGGLEMD